MIQLPGLALPPNAAEDLRTSQADIDSLLSHQDRVAAARIAFAAKNTRTNPTFRSVRELLSAMCSGAQRCCYCEDSAADEVEHIRPKNLYPGQVFVWENYLYACGPCNGPKNSKFAVFDPLSGAIIHITRAMASVATSTPVGDSLLIDPRREDPLHFFELDIVDTFQFVPAFGLPARERERAIYTRDILRLNERDLLIEARRSAYGSYVARLKEYIAERASASVRALEIFVLGIKRMGHPTVWKEIQRQQSRIRSLTTLFRAAAEALDW